MVLCKCCGFDVVRLGNPGSQSWNSLSPTVPSWPPAWEVWLGGNWSSTVRIYRASRKEALSAFSRSRMLPRLLVDPSGRVVQSRRGMKEMGLKRLMARLREWQQQTQPTDVHVTVCKLSGECLPLTLPVETPILVLKLKVEKVFGVSFIKQRLITGHRLCHDHETVGSFRDGHVEAIDFMLVVVNLDLTPSEELEAEHKMISTQIDAERNKKASLESALMLFRLTEHRDRVERVLTSLAVH